MKSMFGTPESILALVITLKEDGEFVGWIDISCANPKNRDGMLDIALLPEFWSKGYGTEAVKFVVDYCFNELCLHRVSLGLVDGNEGAKKAYERVYVFWVFVKR